MSTDTMSRDILTDPFPEAQAAIADRIDEIVDACVVRDFDRPVAYHLAGSKFSNFDELEPLDRQDDETAMRSEVDAFSAIEDLEARIDGLKIDVLGSVAIVTGVFQAAFRAPGSSGQHLDDRLGRTPHRRRGNGGRAHRRRAATR